MKTIYSYRKYVTPEHTKLISMPLGENNTIIGAELATIGDTTYVYLPDDATLPSNQPAEIVNSIETVTLTDTLREQIKAASPHCKLISQRVIDKIRDRYSADDESGMQNKMIAHLAGTELLDEVSLQRIRDAYAYFNECRQWGAEQRAVYGI
jgi:hypothetical protein